LFSQDQVVTCCAKKTRKYCYDRNGYK